MGEKEYRSWVERFVAFVRSTPDDPATEHTRRYAYFDVTGDTTFLYKFFFRVPPALRFFLFCIACIGLNMLGLLSSQATPYSMFYLDTIGTAVAGLLGGLNAGLLVGAASNLVGAQMLDIGDYSYFGICNIICGILWSILPRYGKRYFGANIFEPSPKNGYRNMLYSVFSIGILIGLASSILAYLVQTVIINFEIGAGYLNVDSSAISSTVTKNNILLTAASLGNVDFGPDPENFGAHLFIALIFSNIPDKILSTLIAVLIIVGFLRMPNYPKQTSLIREKGNNFN